MHKILIIDDRPVFAAGIRRIATSAAIGIDLCEHATAGQYTPLLETGPFDAVVVGIPAARDNGKTLLRQLVSQHPATPVLAFCGPCESVYGLQLLRLGARSVVSDQASPSEVEEALRRTLAGRRYISQTLADHLLAHFSADNEVQLRDAIDSHTQLELVRLLALGKPVPVICDTLRISAEDLHAQRREILRRTGLADEQELKRCAFEQRLVPDRRQRNRMPHDALAASRHHPNAPPPQQML
jgi:two-component system invasion response regulator UvrY